LPLACVSSYTTWWTHIFQQLRLTLNTFSLGAACFYPTFVLDYQLRLLVLYFA
jgi:hypothetical protein